MPPDSDRELIVTPSLRIPLDELEWRFTGSGGPDEVAEISVISLSRVCVVTRGRAELAAAA